MTATNTKIFIAVLVLSAGLASACSSDSTEGNEASRLATGSAAPVLPPYEIISQSRSGNTRCSFDVRLEERVLESSIRSIAEEIKSREAEECERTFIVHYLPGMEVDAGGWATSHFTPNLEVRILGMTADQANSAPRLPDGEVVGRWRRDGPLLGGWLTIIRRDNQLIERWDYADGATLRIVSMNHCFLTGGCGLKIRVETPTATTTWWRQMGDSDSMTTMGSGRYFSAIHSEALSGPPVDSLIHPAFRTLPEYQRP